ncbi:MAG: heme-binding domain-containing protein [Flavobacteriaceae bacterium]|jgi:cbb3-type cytochrome oxidase cytochrome c subunit|nr:heme-binding domain-containing protein [Flavobacteriaceae bacterium]
MSNLKKIVLWSLVIIVVIQFIPIDRTNKPVKKSENFTDIYHAPEKVTVILRNACYDCHSNETVYPKYAYIAPISWSIKNHINEGREHLNFSEFGTYDSDVKKEVLKNSIKTLKERAMPIPGYIAYHPKANLTNAKRHFLIEYFEEILNF